VAIRIQDTIKADILLVDDRPEQLVALEAVIADLDQNIVTAHSGKEALRQLLDHDFAVIVLDVNMPGMDGYETATLIRQRRSSEHTPIIFVSAYASTETHISLGYSLGAVDYIQRPVVPEVLRAKVAVFVDLYRKSAELRRLQEAEHRRQLLETQLMLDDRLSNLEREQRRAVRLRQLASASIAINSTLAIEDILAVVADQARRILESHWAEGCLLDHGAQPKRSRARSGESTLEGPPGDPSRVATLLRDIAVPVRLSRSDLESDDRWAALAGPPDRPLIRNYLAAPLVGRQGGNMGYIQLCDKTDGDFTEEDEFFLTELSRMTSLAITNTLYFEAREANRVKDEFLSTLSHELRTPLTAILGWTWLLRSGNLPASDLEEAMNIIDRNARAQAKLIDDMLDISRILTGKLRLNRQTVCFQVQIEGAVDALRPLAVAKGVDLQVYLDPNTPAIQGDGDRLHQVVTNLVSNALKFTPEGGSVEVRLETADDLARVMVRDTGIGIAPDFLPHVFERFRQADAGSTRAQGGLGLGLAIVRHLIELHGGTVEAQSAGEGRGATFTIALPLHGTTDAPAGEVGDAGDGAMYVAEERDAEPLLEGLRILVVDDDDDSRHTIAMVLRQLGAAVIEAGSAEEARDLLQSAPADSKPDVLVSDIAMPGEDGCALMRDVRRRISPAKLPALALSALAREEDRARALAAGFQAHLPKPVTPHQLRVAIAALARTRRAG